MEKLGRLAFEGMAHELQNPADDEHAESIDPEAMDEDTGDQKGNRNQDKGNAEGMAEAVGRILMASRVLRDPLLAGAIPEHARKIIQRVG